jgi:predicted nucleic acid-binding protein
MHLSKVNEALDHKIVGGSEHQWNCWDNARFLDYESDYAHASVVFNSQTQEVYCADVTDKLNELTPYRWLNPEYKEVYFKECKQRKVKKNIAWDDVKWCDLETQNDWLKKAQAIMRGEDFDSRVEVPLDLDDDTLFQLFKKAHENDVTLNKMVEIILQEVITRHQNDNPTR